MECWQRGEQSPSRRPKVLTRAPASSVVPPGVLVGVHFGEAGVLEEKEVFREQVRANVQLVRLILIALDASSSGRVRQEVILKDLESCFGAEEAERQVDTAIDWGRYAELFAMTFRKACSTRRRSLPGRRRREEHVGLWVRRSRVSGFEVSAAQSAEPHSGSALPSLASRPSRQPC
jgi:hypothetical protein